MKNEMPAPKSADVNERAGARGYALLILMMMVTLLLIGMTAAMPSILTQAQREKEAELLFRGAQYARAIAAFHQQFNRYPASVDELLKKTNGRRFLRKAFKDPMVRSGKWRFIHADATGILIDSLTQQAAGAPGMGTGGGIGGASGMNSGFGSTTGPGGATGLGQSSFGQSSTSTGIGASSSSGNQEEVEKQQEEQKKKLEEQIRKECEQANAAPDSSSSNSSSSGSSGPGGGQYIAGVASCSTKESIRVRDGKTHYNEWEFLGIVLAGNPGMPGAQPGTQPGMQPGTQPGNGNQTGAGTAGSNTTGSANGSNPQPNAPAQAGPQIPPLTDQPNQPGESDQPDQPNPPEPEEPQR